MSKEWIATLFGVVLGGLFGSVVWLVMPGSAMKDDVTLYYHQIGIYANASNADNAINQLDSLGIDGYTLKKDGNSVIVCGFVFSKEDSAAIEATLQGAGMPILEKTEMVEGKFKNFVEKGDVKELIVELESR